MHCFGGLGAVVFDEDKDYEVAVAHAEVEEEKINAAEAGAVVEEDRVVDEAEEVAVVAVAAGAPVVREGEGRDGQEEDNAAGEEERVDDDAYANDGNAEVVVEEDRLVDEAEEVGIAVADVDLVVREGGEGVDGEQWAEENDEEGREEIDVEGEEHRVDDASADDEAASEDFVEDRGLDEVEEVVIAVVAVDPVVREVGGRVDHEQSAEENYEEDGMEGKEEDNVAGEEDEVDDDSVDDEMAAAAALAVSTEESSEEEDPALQHVRTRCVLMSRCTVSIMPLVEVNK